MITRPATSSINPTAHAHTATEKPADNKSKGKPKSWAACVCALTSRRGWQGTVLSAPQQDTRAQA